MKPDPSKKIGIHPLGGSGVPKMDTLEKGGARYLLSAGGPVLSTQKTRNKKVEGLMAMALKEKALTAIHHAPYVEDERPLSEYLGEAYKWGKNKPKHYTTIRDKDTEWAGGDLYTTGWYDEKRMDDIIERNKVYRRHRPWSKYPDPQAPMNPDTFIRESLREHYDQGTPKEKAITEAYGSQGYFDRIDDLRSGKIR